MAGLIAAAGVRWRASAQQLPATAEFQRVSNPPRCPLCGTPVEAEPVTLVVAGPAGAIDGSTLAYPALVCPKDGLLFAVRSN